MSFVWNQLVLSEPQWTGQRCCLINEHHNKLRLMQFLMTLNDDFETVQALLLHRKPLPSIDDSLTKILFEETRKTTLQAHQLANAPSETVLANFTSTTDLMGLNKNFSSSKELLWQYYKKSGHTIDMCYKRIKKKSTTVVAATTFA